MPTIISGAQTRWKDCYAPSDSVHLALRTNGEEKTTVIAPNNSAVLAGFEAPTVVPSLAVSSGGTLTASSWYAYRYCYASTNYAYVQNAVTTGNGELWPRSNPSPSASAVTTASNKTITVTVTKTTRSDVDKIVVYRTTAFTTQALADAAAEAGNMFYIATIANNGIAGTASVTDNGLVDTQEILELDNFIADTAWFCVFDGAYWWMAGNPEFTAPVTLNNSTTITIGGSIPWFSGRDGQIATFDDITSTGFDGRGSYYWKWVSSTTGQLYSDPDLTSLAVIPFTGTTNIHLKGFSSTLFRSKPFNPFSWGFTESQIDAVTGDVTNTPQSFALEMGGGSVSALAVLNSGKQLKVDFENPQRVLIYDLTRADLADFGTTQKVLDDTGSVTAHFSQFHGYIGDTPILMGMDTYNGNILACDGTRNQIISDKLGNFLHSLDRDNDAIRFFHGGYDPKTQLNCWWVRLYDTVEKNNIMIWMHSSSGLWGWTPDYDILSSATILDSDSNQRFLIGGTGQGHIGKMFNDTFYDNWLNGLQWRDSSTIAGFGYDGGSQRYTITLNSNISQFHQALVTYDDVGGFTVSGTPTCAVGDTLLIAGGFSGDFSVVVTAIDGSSITVSGWVAQGGGATMSLFVNGSRMNGIFALIFNSTLNDYWLVNLLSTGSSATQYDWRVLEYIQWGSTTVQTSNGSTAASAPWYSTDPVPIFFGAIPTHFRAYFDLQNPTTNKRAFEVWNSAENIDAPFSIGMSLFRSRYYKEFIEQSTAALTFTMLRDSQPGGAQDSMVWFNRQDMPSTILNQFGLEWMQMGYAAFNLYNFTLKANPAS